MYLSKKISLSIFSLFFMMIFCYGKNLEKKSQLEFQMEEIYIKKDNKNIYGRLFKTEEKKFQTQNGNPLVILSHGFGCSYKTTEGYAISFAKNGISAFVFDFVGGGKDSKSGNDTSKMSVLTEAKDLEDVLSFFQNYDGFDKNRIFLFGESQGGFVSSFVAANHPSEIAGLVALYPAYVLQDDSKKRNPNPQNSSDFSYVMGLKIGKIYDIDAQSFDIYDVIKNYSKKVLIIHGTADSIVPISYSERAINSFPNANLIKINGANHGFYGNDFITASTKSIDFIKNQLQ